MHSTVISSVLLSSVLGFFAQQAGARLVPAVQGEVADGHLRMLAKRSHGDADANALGVHRRHHAKNKKRACSAGNAGSGSDSQAYASGASAASYAQSTGVALAASTGSRGSGSGSGSSYTRGSGSGSSSGSSYTASAASSSSSSTSGSSSSSSSNSTSTSSSGDADSALGTVTAFSGTNTGIGSWFRTDNSADSTNGRSWCQTNYEDTWMGFAPSVDTMLAEFSDSTAEAGKAFCGREAKATNPNNGNTALIYIVDGFASEWVRTPGSVDLTLAAFAALYGSTTSDKDIVIENLQWEFTGNYNPDYAYDA